MLILDVSQKSIITITLFFCLFLYHEKKKSSTLSHTLRFPLDFTQKNPS